MRTDFFAALMGTVVVISAPAFAQSDTSFTYQGSLQDSGTPVDGLIPMEFKLFDAEMSGNQVGATISTTVTAVEGVFSESLDFGASAYEANQPLWLEITVDGTVLSRQRLEAAPYALNTRGINVEEITGATNGVTIPEGYLRIELSPLFNLTPSGSYVEAGKIAGYPGVAISRGEVDNEGVQQYRSVIDSDKTLKLRTWDPQDGQQNRMTMTPDGLFGLGTTTPERTLDVAGTFKVELPTNTFTPIGSRFDVQTPGGRPGFFLRKGDGLDGFEHQYYWSIYPDNSLRISSNNASHNTDRLTLDEDGNFGIGTTDPQNKLHVNGDMRVASNMTIGDAGTSFGVLTIRGALGTAISITSGNAEKPGGGSWASLSDRRLKKNVTPLDGALDTLLNLQGVHFEYKDPDAINELPGIRTGFIAQEVEQVIPDWIETKEDGYKRITIRGFEALAVESFRELKDENTELRLKLDQQEARIADLEAKMSSSNPSFQSSSLTWAFAGLFAMGGVVMLRNRNN